MITVVFFLHVIVLTFFTAFIGLYAQTTVQLLLVVVVIVFILGLCLISIGSSVLGAYIIIIYIGAIVILFAFCILFINSREGFVGQVNESKKSSLITKFISFLALLALWEGFTSLLVYGLSKNALNSFFSIVSEQNYMVNLAGSLYGELFIPLTLMIGVLLLGLILVIRIIKQT